MKTLELELKKKVLIVDENDFEYYELSKNGIYFKIEKGDRYYLGWKFEFLCKGSELTEEIASELAFDGFNISENKKVYVDHCDECNCFESAIKSVISYVRIEGFHWLENPLGNETIFSNVGNIKLVNEQLEWERIEAEEKTFKNPLIFVKK